MHGSSLQVAMTRLSGPAPGLRTGFNAPHHFAASPHVLPPHRRYAAYEGKGEGWALGRTAGLSAVGQWHVSTECMQVGGSRVRSRLKLNRTVMMVTSLRVSMARRSDELYRRMDRRYGLRPPVGVGSCGM